MGVRIPTAILPVLVFVPAAAYLGRLLPEARQPQVASGGDVLSVLFGDAKEVLSAAMVHKADSYFHGGVDIQYEECLEKHGREDCGRGRPQNEPACRADAPARTRPDPWRWINDRVRAPHVEQHLEGERAVELMPWFWASVRANPHNVEAWTATWYVAAHVMKDRALAARVLEEATRHNPDSPEIALTAGQFLYDGGRGDVEAAAVAFRRAQRLALDRAGGDTSKLSEEDGRTHRFAGNYLRKIEERN